MPTITVDLDDRSYPIQIEAGILSDAGFLFSELKRQRVIVITNETIQPLYAELVVKRFEQLGKQVELLSISDGEQYKSLSTFEWLMTQLLERSVARDVCIVALGGGVVGDISGFVAACYQRGVDFVQIPTTLLSQVDSSVGGKTAVNHPLGKNMIGAFYQPKAVYIDIDTLRTLPAKEFAAGMAEVIKYGIIYDADFFTWLETNKTAIRELETNTLATMIARCCQIKAEVVNLDEKESGIRALLNLGHTFGHAIEAEQGYGSWLHGEAVGAGMVLAAKLSNMRDDVNLTDLKRIEDLLAFFDIPTKGPSTMTSQDYVKHMKRDKKVENGTMRFILPEGIGKAKIVSDVSMQELVSLLD